MWKHIHSEQNVLLCTGGHISQRINRGALGRLPGICPAMNQRDGLPLPPPESGRESGKARAPPAAPTARRQRRSPLVFIGIHGAPAVPSFWAPAESGPSLTMVFLPFSLIPSIQCSQQMVWVFVAGAGTANLGKLLRAYFSERATNCKKIRLFDSRGAND